MENSIVTNTFLFNIVTVIIFSIIYYSLDPKTHFQPLNPIIDLKYLDFLFYAVTIQSGIGLPDVTVISDLAKILAIIQQLILMGSAFIIIHFFFQRKK